MTKKSRNRTPKVRRLVGVLSGVATTALCLSFAYSAIGGALRPANSPIASPIVVAATLQDPVVVPQPPAPPIFSAKRPTPAVGRKATKIAPAEKAAATSTSAPRADAVASGRTSAEADNSLLRTESKSSRTRGQPGLG